MFCFVSLYVSFFTFLGAKKTDLMHLFLRECLPCSENSIKASSQIYWLKTLDPIQREAVYGGPWCWYLLNKNGRHASQIPGDMEGWER